MTRTGFIALIGLLATSALSQGRGSDPDRRSGYKATAFMATGTIQGTVSISGTVKPDEIPVTKDGDFCGRKKKLPRLSLGKNNAVRNAVVYLENIASGKPFPTSSPARLSQDGCEFQPHVVLIPVGSPLTIVNNDRILHNIHAYGNEMCSKTMFNIAQPLRGQRSIVNGELMKETGFLPLTCDAGHPWMSGYIVVTPHPYYALTDASGKYELRDVPPGRYRLKMWHEGIAVTSTPTGKSYSYEDPYEEVRDIVVNNNSTTTADFTFTAQRSRSSVGSR